MDQKLSIRLWTAVVTAIIVAIPAGLAAVLGFSLLLNVTGGRLRFDDLSGAVSGISAWLTLCCLAASGAAWIVTSLMNRRRLHRAVRIVLLAVLTKLLAVMLMPVVMAIWSAPGALSGGQMPCFHIGNTCEAGLHGLDAVRGLVVAALSWYPLGVFLILPGLIDVILLIPAAIWDRVMAAEVARSGAGTLCFDRERLEEDLTRFGAYGGHHVGTTRMGLDRRSSVVDGDCRVHGVRNLFIASSAVFPTSSQANPTLTIIALALRLAEHIRSKSLTGQPPALTIGQGAP